MGMDDFNELYLHFSSTNSRDESLESRPRNMGLCLRAQGMDVYRVSGRRTEAMCFFSENKNTVGTNRNSVMGHAVLLSVKWMITRVE